MSGKVFIILLYFFIPIYLDLLSFSIANGEPQVLPKELLELAKKNNCDQITNYYVGKPSMVKPPYVYGYASGPEESSAAFWCERIKNGEKINVLMFMYQNPNNDLAKCPNQIEWINPARGLSIYKYPKLTLDKFVFLENPQKNGEKNILLENNGILSEYDGVSTLFYCHKGKWLIRQLH